MAVGDGVAAARFNGVAHSVAQVQQAPLALFLFVPLHHAGLVGDAPGDDLRRIGGEGAVLKEGKERLVAQDAGFDGLGGAVGKDVRREAFQTVGVAQYGGGLQKGPGQVLSGSKVDGGLAAHGGIHGGKKRGGQLHAADAPEVHGGGKARHVPSHTAAQSHHAVGAGQMLQGQELQDLREGGEILVSLACGELVRTDGKSGGAETGGDSGGIEGGHGAVGNDCRPAGPQYLPQPLSAAFQQPRSDGDGVAGGGANGDGLNGVGHGKNSFIYNVW